MKSLSRVQLLATPWTVAYQAPPSMGFSRQEYWSGVPLPSPQGMVRFDQISHSPHNTKWLNLPQSSSFTVGQWVISTVQTNLYSQSHRGITSAFHKHPWDPTCIKQAKACGLDLKVDGVFPKCAGFFLHRQEDRLGKESFPEDTLLRHRPSSSQEGVTQTQPRASRAAPVSVAEEKSRRVFFKLCSDVLNRPHSSGPLFWWLYCAFTQRNFVLILELCRGVMKRKT